MSVITKFQGRRAVLTTMNRTGDAIGPMLQARLGLIVDESDRVDTDQLGTVTGTPRASNMLEGHYTSVSFMYAKRKRITNGAA